ncbi:hypothetical protein D3C78_1645810 [compost metagenome]
MGNAVQDGIAYRLIVLLQGAVAGALRDFSYATARPFSNFLTHIRFGFNAANRSASPGKGSPNSCAAKISAASGAEHNPREPNPPIMNRLG